MDVVGIDKNMRDYFFVADGSTHWNTLQLQQDLKNYTHHSVDIRDEQAINGLFAENGDAIDLVVHCAAQPSHDWAAREPTTDFTVNANGTLVMLQATRTHAPDAVFLFTSTNKVYGDTPNRLPLVELERRWELPPEHPWGLHGIDETMSIDQTKHSIFGV